MQSAKSMGPLVPGQRMAALAACLTVALAAWILPTRAEEAPEQLSSGTTTLATKKAWQRR